MSPDHFASSEFWDYTIYKTLAAHEKNSDFKKILEELVQHEWGDYQFWLQFSQKKHHHVPRVTIWFMLLMRRYLGLTFTAKFIERNEHIAVRNYEAYQKTAAPHLQDRIQQIIDHEKNHEKRMISRIKEEQVEFMGNIILGLNDGLIELTGSLVGFSFAFRASHAVALAGVITGLAATMSMASSAYMQARHNDEGKHPGKAALYTGIAYFIVVVFLITPFIIFSSIEYSLPLMLCIVMSIITAVSYYTSIIFDRTFKRQFGEMLLFSAGVACITFVIGFALRAYTGIEL